jgi:hypothetical protein
MILLFEFCETPTNYSESIFISIISSGIFGLIIFVGSLVYDYCKQFPNLSRYDRIYKGNNSELQGKIAASAIVRYSYKNELKINVTTFINEDDMDNHQNHYLFPNESIQKWEGKITMENSETGNLHFYYVEPENLKNSNITHFKRIVFLRNSKYLHVIGEGGWKEEGFERN